MMLNYMKADKAIADRDNALDYKRLTKARKEKEWVRVGICVNILRLILMYSVLLASNWKSCGESLRINFQIQPAKRVYWLR